MFFQLFLGGLTLNTMPCTAIHAFVIELTGEANELDQQAWLITHTDGTFYVPFKCLGAQGKTEA